MWLSSEIYLLLHAREKKKHIDLCIKKIYYYCSEKSFTSQGRKHNNESAREQEKVRYLDKHTFGVHCTQASTMPRHMSAATVLSTADYHTQAYKTQNLYIYIHLKHIQFIHRLIYSHKKNNSIVYCIIYQEKTEG